VEIDRHCMELEERGFCVLKGLFPKPLVQSCRNAFWPMLSAYLDAYRDEPNRGPHRHFLPMPFHTPCFSPEFFFNGTLLALVQRVMGDRIVADQWGSDTPVLGSIHQGFHADYRRPLFEESPHLLLPPYFLVANFGLIDIESAHGPLEIAPKTHRMPRDVAMLAIKTEQIKAESVLLTQGDVLVRHPWTLHRGTPNQTQTPRPLLSIRYVRQWYWDDSRDVCAMSQAMWQSFTPSQRRMMRFPLEA
jgi:hypothetical protein